MAETGETLRTGGSSPSGTQSSPTRPGLADVKVDTETEWTPVTRRRRLRSKTPDPAVVEETKRLRSTAPTPDTGDSTKMELADEETRKRALVEPTEDDDEHAEKFWRAEDFVAKASTDELTGTWITDENGILDEDAAGDTWTDCLGAGGELDRQAAEESTKKALDSLLARGVVEDAKREDAKGFKTLTTRWDKRWRMKDGEMQNEGENSLDENTNGQNTEKTYFILERRTM